MGRLRVDTEALASAAGTLRHVTGSFVSDGTDNAGSLGEDAIGHPGLTYAVSDFCEQARRVAVDLDANVSSLGTAAHSSALRYEQTEGANTTFFDSLFHG
jgi:hypothetical protein